MTKTLTSVKTWLVEETNDKGETSTYLSIETPDGKRLKVVAEVEE